MRLETPFLSLVLAAAGLLMSAQSHAVDLVGVYQDALDYDPVLQAAAGPPLRPNSVSSSTKSWTSRGSRSAPKIERNACGRRCRSSMD